MIPIITLSYIFGMFLMERKLRKTYKKENDTSIEGLTVKATMVILWPAIVVIAIILGIIDFIRRIVKHPH